MSVHRGAVVPRRPVTLVVLGVLGTVTVVHLAALWSDTTSLVNPTRWLLMPLLVTALLVGSTGPRGRLLWLTVVALGFSWLGDTLPSLADGTTAFLILVGCFLLAQICYLVALWPYRADSVAVRRRWLVLPYVAAIGVLVVVCAPHAGALLVPVLVYGLCLGAMAVLATSLGVAGAVGGALFVLSDGLIAIRAFAELQLPEHDIWVMASYVAAQVLIGAGVLLRSLGSSVSTTP